MISFGLVNIPVKLFSAAESGARISFNQLHGKCKTRIKQQLYCPTDEQVVPREEIVKGYEFAKDQYVLFSEDELRALEEASSKAMQITEFVPLGTVDPLFFDGGYYLGPDKGGARAYRLLAAALEQTQYAAVAQYVTRGKQTLILIRAARGALVMQQMRYADEVKALSEIPLGDADVKPAELELAKRFIDELSSQAFDPTKYKDEYRAKLQEIIDRKVKGEEVALTPAPAAPPVVVDLMEALKASLAKGKAAGDAAEERKPPKRAARGGAAAPAAKPKAKRG